MRRRQLRYYRRRNVQPAGLICLMICFAALIRLMNSLGLGAALDSALIRLGSNRSFVCAALEAETGSVFTNHTASAPSPSPEISGDEAPLPSEQPSPEPETPPETADIILSASPDSIDDESIVLSPQPLEFTADDAQAIEYTNATSYTPDTFALLTEPLELNPDLSGPLVLIVHTHTCEAYTQEYDGQYSASDSWRTTDQEQNIVAVGNELAAVLTGCGIGVIHDTTVNDYPSYTGSYTRTLEVIQQNLEKYPSIQIVIDLHRDSGVTATGEAIATYYNGGDEPASQLMLVVGTDEGGLSHPNWRENLKLALALQAVTNSEHPGLMRPINLRQERFNQHTTCGSLIVETGFAGNTLSQAKAAIRLFGESLCRVISSQSKSQ